MVDNPRYYNATLYHYSRNLDGLNSSSSSSSGAVTTPQFFKHWGLVVHFLDEDEDEGLPKQFLYHANKEGGKLKASFEEFTRKIKNLPGAECTELGKNIQVSKTDIEGFCHGFNAEDRAYIATESNCQTFVEELIIHLELSKACLPFFTAEKAKKTSWFGFSSASTCVSNVSGWTISRGLILKFVNLNPENAKKLFGEAMKYGLTHKPFLECAGFQNYMKDIGKQAFLTSSGKAMESGLRIAKGVFSPWQLLQIPVELLTKELVKAHGFKTYTPKEKDEFAFALSKVTSCGTAATCAGLIAGPSGVLVAIAFWCAAEVVSYIMRKVTMTYFQMQLTQCNLAAVKVFTKTKRC
jgi:hypothetical protein